MKKVKYLLLMLVSILSLVNIVFADASRAQLTETKAPTIKEQMDKILGPSSICPICNQGEVVRGVYYTSYKGGHFNYCNKKIGGMCFFNYEEHNWVNGACSVCGADEFFDNSHIDVTYETDEAGNLIINMDHDMIRGVWAKYIEIKIDEEEIFSQLAGLGELQPSKINYLEDNNEVQLLEGRLALIIRPNSNLAKKLGTGQHSLQVEFFRKYLGSDVTKETLHKTKIELWYKGKATIETKFEGAPKEATQPNAQVANYVYEDYQDLNHWAWGYVSSMLEKGILQPKEDEQGKVKLEPNDNITYEQFIALLARVLGYNGEEIADDSLYVPMKGIEDFWSENEWKFLMQRLGADAKTEMQALLANNSKNASDEEIAYNYKTHISRERVAFLLGKFFKSDISFTNNADIEKFEDWNKIESAYALRCRILAANDILKGKTNDNVKLYISPKDYLTKLEAITLIDRFYSAKEAGKVY